MATLCFQACLTPKNVPINTTEFFCDISITTTSFSSSSMCVWVVYTRFIFHFSPQIKITRV